MPLYGHRGRGDLYVHLAIEVPTKVDDETERLLRELAAHRDEMLDEGHRGLFHRRSGRK
jgi:molecular chaperone DnaJ